MTMSIIAASIEKSKKIEGGSCARIQSRNRAMCSPGSCHDSGLPHTTFLKILAFLDSFRHWRQNVGLCRRNVLSLGSLLMYLTDLSAFDPLAIEVQVQRLSSA